MPAQPKSARRMSVQELIDAGDTVGALEEAQAALGDHANDRQLRAFVELSKRLELPAIRDNRFKARTSALLAEIRGGKAGRAKRPRAAVVRDDVPPPAAHLLLDAARKYVVGDYPAVRALLDRLLRENPGNEPALRLRAFTLRKMKLYDASAADAKAALALSPRDFRALRALIGDQMDLGRPKEALEEANHALLEAPDPQLFAARAYVWGRMGDRGKEIEDLKQAAALDAAFDRLYEQAVLSGAAPGSRWLLAAVVWLGAVAALLFFYFVVLRDPLD